MKPLGLNVNSTSLSRKIYWKIFHKVSPAQNSIPALKWWIYGPSFFLYENLLRIVSRSFASRPGKASMVSLSRADYCTLLGICWNLYTLCCGCSVPSLYCFHLPHMMLPSSDRKAPGPWHVDSRMLDYGLWPICLDCSQGKNSHPLTYICYHINFEPSACPKQHGRICSKKTHKENSMGGYSSVKYNYYVKIFFVSPVQQNKISSL